MPTLFDKSITIFLGPKSRKSKYVKRYGDSIIKLRWIIHLWPTPFISKVRCQLFGKWFICRWTLGSAQVPLGMFKSRILKVICLQRAHTFLCDLKCSCRIFIWGLVLAKIQVPLNHKCKGKHWRFIRLSFDR